MKKIDIIVGVILFSFLALPSFAEENQTAESQNTQNSKEEPAVTTAAAENKPAEAPAPPAEPTPAPAAAETSAPAPAVVEAPAPAAPQPVSAQETILVDDSIPEGATQDGNWVWDEDLKMSGTKSHTEPPKAGMYSHSFKFSTPIHIKEGSKILQYVYLDPQNPPKGVILKFKLKTDEEVGVYWEGSEEAVTNSISDEELLWYQGELPKKGEWIKLEVPAEEAEIENEDIVGISYCAMDGKINWDKTSVEEGGQQDQTKEE